MVKATYNISSVELLTDIHRHRINTMADDAKKFLALLNGIARRTYFGEDELSDEFLASQIYHISSVELLTDIHRHRINNK
jgi:hypothetical protein